MAQIDIVVAGRTYELACRDGDEPHLLELARIVDRKAADAVLSAGGVNEARQMLMAALLLADELNDVRAVAAATRLEPATVLTPAQPDAAQPGLGQPDLSLIAAIERLATRMESLAQTLET